MKHNAVNILGLVVGYAIGILFGITVTGLIITDEMLVEHYVHHPMIEVRIFAAIAISVVWLLLVWIALYVSRAGKDM